MNIILLYLVIINTLHSVNMSQFDFDVNWMSPEGNQPSIVSDQSSQPTATTLSTIRAKPTCGPVSFPDYSCEGPTTPLAILKRSDVQTSLKPQQALNRQLPPQVSILRSSYEIDKTPWQPKVGREIIRTFKKDVTTWKSMLFPQSNYGKFGGSLFDSILGKDDYTFYEEPETQRPRPSEKQLSQPPPQSPPQSPHFRSEPLNQPNLAAHPPIPKNIPVNNNIMFRNNNAMLTGKTDRYSVNGVSQYVMRGGMTSRYYMQHQMNLKFRVSAQPYPYRNIPISTARGLKYKYNPATYYQPPVRTIKEPYQGFHIANMGLSKAYLNQNKGKPTVRYLPSRINFVTVAPASSQGDTIQTMRSIGQLLQTVDIQNTPVGAWPKFKPPNKVSENVPSKEPIFNGTKVHHTSSSTNPEENTRDHNIDIHNTSPTLATDGLSKHETTAGFLKQDDLLRILNFNKDLKENSVVTTSHDRIVTNSLPNKLLSVESQTQSNTVNNAFSEGITINMNHGFSVDNTATKIASDNIGIPSDAPGGISSPPVTFGDQFDSNIAQISKVNNQSRDDPNTSWSSQDTTMTPVGNYTVPDVSNIIPSSVPVQSDTSQRTMFDNNNKRQWSHIESKSSGATTSVDKLAQSMMLGMAPGQSFDAKSQDGQQRNIYPQDNMQYGVTPGNVVLPQSEISPGITAAGNVISQNVMSGDNTQSVVVELKYITKPQSALISTQ